MALEFKLPDIGEGIAEGEIVKWLVKTGDTVAEHQAVVEVMTDKATVEVPAPRAGKIVELRAKEGQVVPVGSVIFVLETAAGSAPMPAAHGGQGGQTAPASAPAAQTAKAPAAPAAAPKAASAPAPVGHYAPAASAGGVLEFRLPDIGEGIAEGEIVKWLVSVGDSVQEHQAVVEVMTDKATVEVPAPRAGKITELRAKAGQVVPVGSVIFVLAVAGAAAAQAAPAAAHSAPAAAHSAPAAAPAQVAHLAQPVGAAAAPAAARSSGKVLAAPSARRVARELKIDLGTVSGSGRNGMVRRADVEAFAKGGVTAPLMPAASAAPATVKPAAVAGAPAAPVVAKGPVISLTPGQAETRVPFRGVRRKISEAMVRSKYTAPHFTVVEELDVTELVRLRERAKELGLKKGLKVTYMPFIMKACANALKEFPMLNSKLDEAAQELVTYHQVHLGIATDTPNGLIVPVIKNVEQKSVLVLAKELAEMAERTRAGKVSSEDLRGSTFSITNAGNIGGILATPIINFPDAAILGVHRMVKRPGVVEAPEGDRIEVRQYMNLSISVDHRLVDGADGVRFLVHMKELLENPGLLAL
jgi:pyruvate dehydrogenase E2 component (dihydrolipoamide acetyltransferase)